MHNFSVANRLNRIFNLLEVVKSKEHTETIGLFLTPYVYQVDSEVKYKGKIIGNIEQYFGDIDTCFTSRMNSNLSEKAFFMLLDLVDNELNKIAEEELTQFNN